MMPRNHCDDEQNEAEPKGGTPPCPCGKLRTNGPIDQILADLYDAYLSDCHALPFRDFRNKLLEGVAVWADLDLSVVRRTLPQLMESTGGSSPEKHPIRTGELQRLLDKLLSLTMEDGLTGLFNRRYFDHRLQQELQRSRREQVACAVMLADVDDFKRINDHHGHDAGDRALQRVSQLLKSSLRASDEVTARFGGEEFAILLPNTGRKQAYLVAERVRQRIASTTISLPDGEQVQLSVSIGLSTSLPPHPLSTEMIVKQADQALYGAKQSGKNQVQCFDGCGDQDEEDEVSRAERAALLK